MAQDFLTIDQAIQEGLTNSPEIQRARAVQSIYQWKKLEALGQGFLPKISVSANHFFTARYVNSAMNFGGVDLVMPGMYPMDQLSLDIVLPLFDGLSNCCTLKASRLLAEASDQEFIQSQFKLEQMIRLAFYEALTAGILKQVAEKNLEALQSHLQHAQLKEKAGSATHYDYLRVEFQVNEAQVNVLDAQDHQNLTRQKLAQWMGLAEDFRNLEGVLPVPQQSFEQEVSLSRADLLAAQLKASAANQIAKKSWLMPTFYLSGQYVYYNQQSYANQTVRSTGDFKNAYNVGLVLKWNLFDGAVSYAQEQEAQLMAIQADKSAELLQQQIPYDLNYWKKHYISASKHYRSQELNIQCAQESLRLAQIEFVAGTRTYNDILDSTFALFQARSGIVQSQMNAMTAQIQLELALGRRVSQHE